MTAAASVVGVMQGCSASRNAHTREFQRILQRLDERLARALDPRSVEFRERHLPLLVSSDVVEQAAGCEPVCLGVCVRWV